VKIDRRLTQLRARLEGVQKMPGRVSGLPNVRRRKRPPQLRHDLAAKLNWTSTGESAAAANGAAKQTHGATTAQRVWRGAASVGRQSNTP
jgi:hypothetical protein